MIEIKSMTWADEMTGVDLMMPSQIKPGMRMARQVREHSGGHHTALIPVWGVSLSSGRWVFLLCTGERVALDGACRAWVEPEVRFLPPLETTWITNEKFGTDFDRAFMERSRVVESFTHSQTGDRYERRHGRSRLGEERWDGMRILRTTAAGVQWWAPARYSPEGLFDQWDEIKEGRGW